MKVSPPFQGDMTDVRSTARVHVQGRAMQFAAGTILNTPEMYIAPIRNQLGVSLPSGIRMSNAFAHNESGWHGRVIQTPDEPTRLLNRCGLILVSVNQNCWWVARSHMRLVARDMVKLEPRRPLDVGEFLRVLKCANPTNTTPSIT